MGQGRETVEKLRITVLADDYAGQNSPYWAQHGVAYLVDVNVKGRQKRILFDTGSCAEPILHNLSQMKLDPADIDMIVLSHSHFDHTGGLIGILRAMQKEYVPILVHPAINRTSFTADPFWFDVGYSMVTARREAARAGGHWVLAASPLPLGAGMLYSGTVPRDTEFESGQRMGLYTLNEGKTIPDEIMDDISLYFRTGAGLVVVTGCAHAGIVNVINHGVKLTEVEHVTHVIGGFHLINSDDERIGKTVANLRERPGLKIYTGHCTGLKAESRLLDAFGSNFVKLHCGMVIDIE
ncbi:MAG: MBL fold metallo-hydrolase [Christensenellaceae bacterium]|jgi:7,8-dihydropterin-6-yl-methyl-4-(beta-D-ribofuranosyl)aminobenzene 5'-phosphate synthase